MNEISNCKSHSSAQASTARLTFFFVCFSADPDGNVIFELNKLEIDDAHKDKQKIFNVDFKVTFAVLPTETLLKPLSPRPFQIQTIFQRLPNGVRPHLPNHMNTNGGIHANGPREANYGHINHLNNNASININNNINQPSNHIVAVPQLPSQSSNGRLPHGVPYGQTTDPRQSGNYNTTSECSTSPESSSESSEEWESGELNHFNIA